MLAAACLASCASGADSNGGRGGGGSGGSPGGGGSASDAGTSVSGGGGSPASRLGSGGGGGALGPVGDGGAAGVAGGGAADAGVGNDAGSAGSGGGGTAGSRADGGSGRGVGGTGGVNVDGGSRDAPPLGAKVAVHVVGDSTAAVFPATDATHRVGWAAVLDPMFDATVTVDDAAKSGRSTKSYIDEGSWSQVQATIAPGDYLFVEFGHNDEKSDDPTRYTDPATTYRANLRMFVNGARAKGGVPVLLTSICRRVFSGGAVTGTHGAYTAAVAAVAEETGTPLLDMESKTKAWLTALGPTNSISMFATDDNTHLSMQGAVAVAKLAVQGIRELGIPLAERVLP